MKLRMPKPSSSSRIHALQNIAHICLKQKALKIDGFAERPKSALGTVDRMIVFRYLQVGHLPKKQVVGSEDIRRVGPQQTRCGILSLNCDYVRLAFFASYRYPSNFK
jgi:hypothetical protein